MTTLQDIAARRLAEGGRGRGIRYEGMWYGWDRIDATARHLIDLIAASGAPDEATVLFIAGNTPAELAALLALLAEGRTVRFLYPFQSGEAIAAKVTELKPGVVLAAEPVFTDEVREAVARRGACAIALDTAGAFVLPGLERSTAAPDPDAPAEPTLDIQTSGTTGPAKRFPVTYDDALLHWVRRAISTAVGGEDENAPPAMLYAAMGNLSGMMGTLPSLVRGCEIILHARFDLEGWLDYVRTYRPALSGLQPAAVQMLLDTDTPREDLSSLTGLIVGSAPLRPEQREAFEQRFGVPVILAYGATEFYGTAASMTPELLAKWGDAKRGSVGPAVPGFELRVVDGQTGDVLGPDEEGVLEVRSQDIGPDWIHTSDLAVIDADGFLTLHGRADGAIIRGGFKLLPEAIEHALMEHEAVAMAAVVGVRDHRLGQVPAAAVQAKRGRELPGFDALEAHLRRLLPATHIPVYWRAVEEFPRTPSLKIERGTLTRMFEDGEG